MNEYFKIILNAVMIGFGSAIGSYLGTRLLMDKVKFILRQLNKAARRNKIWK